MSELINLKMTSAKDAVKILVECNNHQENKVGKLGLVASIQTF